MLQEFNCIIAFKMIVITLFRTIIINLNIHELKVFHHVSIFSNEYRLGHHFFCLGGNQDDKIAVKA